MKKEIKIRVWNKIEKVMFSIGSNPNLTNYQTTIYELMQFTGLKDKNGKEIYEGDIFKKSNYFYQVVFEDGMFGVWTKNYGWKVLTKFKFIEVIGNIYENPELLNKQKP